LFFKIKTKITGNNFGYLPIHKAAANCSETDPDLLQYIIDSYTEGLLSRNIEGLVPLHLACTGAKATMNVAATILYSEPSAAECIDNYGQLPLHKMCSRGSANSRIVSLLIETFPTAVNMAYSNG